MTHLAYNKGEMMTSEELAAGIRTNPTVIRRLVSKLVDAGLLLSFKGKAGGIKLAKNPKEISLRDVYVAVSDKTLIASPLKDPNKNCIVSCAMKKLMCDVISGLEANSLQYLGNIRLSDLTAKICK